MGSLLWAAESSRLAAMRAVASGVLDPAQAVSGYTLMWASIFELGIGVLAAGVTTTMGFLATKLVIDSMARKLRPAAVQQTRQQ